jgi:hypothetical protein
MKNKAYWYLFNVFYNYLKQRFSKWNWCSEFYLRENIRSRLKYKFNDNEKNNWSLPTTVKTRQNTYRKSVGKIKECGSW